MTNITIADTGFVGLSCAVLLAQHKRETALDIVPAKVELINERQSPTKQVQRPVLWDGKAAQRIVAQLGACLD